MKSFFTLLVFIFSLQIGKTQTYVTIPDANFVAWLQANAPSAMNGNQMDITSLAITGKTKVILQSLNISDLTGIQYFNSLDTFICMFNPIVALPPLSNNVKHIDIYGSQLTSLPTLPTSLIYLRCVQSQLTNLPTLPSSLTQLFCSSNQLNSLPNLPNSIIAIECHDNLLSSLPSLPNTLIYFSCGFNQLTTLPTLPNSLYSLYCNNNYLNNLPLLPTSLHELNCSNNQLTSLPELPIGLSMLYCSHNNITCFPRFPNSLREYIPTTSSSVPAVDIKFNPFTCLPNYVLGMDLATLSTPLCIFNDAINNPNNCMDYKKIIGIVFRDNNNNCVKTNVAEIGIRNIPIKLYDVNNLYLESTFNTAISNYSFTVPAGIYKVIIDTINMPYMSQCSNPGIDSLININATQLIEDSVNFPFICKPGFDIGVQSIVANGIVFPQQTHTLNVNAGDIAHWYSLNCAVGISGTVSFSVNGPVTYVGPAFGALTPLVSGNVYTYNIADFGTINNSNSFNLMFTTDVTAQSGDMICVNATVTTIVGDNNPLNNTYQYCYPVINSYDPNIKEVYPVEVQQGFNDWLTYTIRFQNTGNASAINIRLEDQLDNMLNPETFQVINYSHNNLIDLIGNHLIVRFPNIQLADSTSNPQGSIGFIQYRIKPKASWVTDTIKNSAAIFFDFNAPIVTNTAKSYFVTTIGINELTINNAITLLPNPTNAIVTINSKFDMQQIEIINLAGQILLQENVNNKTHQLQLQNFADGIYFVKISYSNGLSTTKKIVVNH